MNVLIMYLKCLKVIKFADLNQNFKKSNDLIDNYSNSLIIVKNIVKKTSECHIS